MKKKNNGSEISQAVQELLDKNDPFDNKKKISLYKLLVKYIANKIYCPWFKQ